MSEPDCLFCLIKNKKVPAAIVYEDEFTIAFLDIFPFNAGHTIVIPKQHCYNFLEFDDGEMKNFFSAVKKISNDLKNKLNSEGINIFSNNYPAAGQVINHMHFHIVPRWINDGLPPLGKQKKEATPEQLQSILDKLSS
jgi:histidine triad (HIT) family protein